ncbi:hypothetical protein INR49_031357 [Caranx melampygus]|nr:hypothetical protein INR49_031357 [Caranx melampygus]
MKKCQTERMVRLFLELWGSLPMLMQGMDMRSNPSAGTPRIEAVIIRARVFKPTSAGHVSTHSLVDTAITMPTKPRQLRRKPLSWRHELVMVQTYSIAQKIDLSREETQTQWSRREMEARQSESSPAPPLMLSEPSVRRKERYQNTDIQESGRLTPSCRLR